MRMYLYRWRQPGDTSGPVYTQHALDVSALRTRSRLQLAPACCRPAPPGCAWQALRGRSARALWALAPSPTPAHPPHTLTWQCGYETGEDRIYLRLPVEICHVINEGARACRRSSLRGLGGTREGTGRQGGQQRWAAKEGCGWLTADRVRPAAPQTRPSAAGWSRAA